MLSRFTHHVFSDLAVLRRFWRERGARAAIAWIGSLDSPVTFQFAKYLLFGVVTSVVHLGLFAWLSHTVFPAHDYLRPGGFDDAFKQHNALLSNLIAFPAAAVVNYGFNIVFIFTTGRHSRIREFTLFLLLSSGSFAAGLLAGPFLISHGLNPWIAQAGLMATSALVNFVGRKFFVFLR